MDIAYPPLEEPATPEYVLAVLRDMHRQQCGYDAEADPSIDLSRESTVAEWQEGCDLVGWRELGRACNESWGIACSDAEWREVLSPVGRNRLGGVCDLIAGRTTRPRVRPSRLFRGECVSAGAFRTIRSLLHDAGVPADEIAPCTPLAPYARRYAGVFLGPISRLAPGALPLVRIRTPVYDGAMWGFLAGLLCLPIGACAGPLFTAAGIGLCVAGNAISWFAGLYLLPAGVEFGELRTFRDLSVVVACGCRFADPEPPSGG